MANTLPLGTYPGMATPRFFAAEPPALTGTGQRPVTVRRLVWWHVRQQLPLITIVTVANVVNQALSLSVPFAISKIYDLGVAPANYAAVLTWGVWLTLATVGVVLTSAMRYYCGVRFGARIKATMLRALNRHITNTGAMHTKHTNSGELNTIATRDMQKFTNFCSIALLSVGSAIVAPIALVILWQLAPLVAGAFFAGVVASVVVSHFLAKYNHKAEEAYRDQHAQFTDRSYDVMTGLRVLAGLGGKTVYAKRVVNDSDQLRERGLALAHRASLLSTTTEYAPLLINAAAVWAAGYAAVVSGLTAGQVIQAVTITVVLAWPVYYLMGVCQFAPAAIVAGRRVSAVFNTTTETPDHPVRPMPVAPAKLTDPTTGMVVEPGVSYGVVTQDPAVASAILNRFARFGTDEVAPARWAGHPVTDYPLADFRRCVQLGQGQAHLFEGSLREMLTLGEPVTDARLEQALAAAHATDIVQALPDGLATAMSAGASNVSGGQRQRLRLVRALLRHPEVLLLEQPTSALDATTEAAVAAGVVQYRAGATTVIATTSPLVLAHCDQVFLVTEDGAAQLGTHAQLCAEAAYRSVVFGDRAALPAPPEAVDDGPEAGTDLAGGGS